ncbi:MAG: VOC family protein [Gemmatimonadetes bacterium]|nr:VOC family protein [Gemmatimonadota bacterium]
MGASTHDLFGNATTAQPATPGSYGEAPAGYRLPDATRLGAAHLQVADLARSLRFYADLLGFRVIEQTPTMARLGGADGQRTLIALHEKRGVQPAGRRALIGLYHVAILLPDRPSLGRFLRAMAEQRVHVGAGDHLVSEALYLTDPDGLGLEVYADRPRDAWHRLGRELMLATDPVDFESLLAAGGETRWSGMPAGTVVGHVHLHVGALDEAARFYADGIGFDKVTWRYPGALFMGAGGYHHHLGTNTWAGPHARPAGDDDARLLRWTIELPSAASLDEVSANLRARGFAAESVGSEVVTRDPWGTTLALAVAGS